MAEPPLLSGASHDRSSFPVSFTDTVRLPGMPGTAAATAAVAALVRVPPRLLASSVNEALTLIGLALRRRQLSV